MGEKSDERTAVKEGNGDELILEAGRGRARLLRPQLVKSWMC